MHGSNYDLIIYGDTELVFLAILPEGHVKVNAWFQRLNHLIFVVLGGVQRRLRLRL